MNEYELQYGKEWAFFSPDGSAYKGTWKNALRHGFGCHIYSNGDVYVGEFQQNLPHGVGRFYSRSPKLPAQSKKEIVTNPQERAEFTLVYDGQWSAGFRQGFGRFYYSENSFYAGFWHSNLKHGRGVLFYSPQTDRASVLLEKLQDQQPVVEFVDGQAKVRKSLFKTGAIFIGNFDCDLRRGEGFVLYENGDVFAGNFEENAANGSGVFYFVQRHGKMSGDYVKGAQVRSVYQTEWESEDYELVLKVWSHVSGGHVLVSQEVQEKLCEYYQCDWEDDFVPDPEFYPYNLRQPHENDSLILEKIMLNEPAEEICQLLPLKMRKEQSNIQKILHFPIQDHGQEIPENKLVDPMSVLMK